MADVVRESAMSAEEGCDAIIAAGRSLVENVQVCFREHRLLREALLALMAEARPYLEPAGSVANAAMLQARDALEGSESR